MGGGVFNNAQDWIDDAIKKAIDDPVLQNSGLEVTLNNFGFSFGVDVNPIRKRLIKLAQDNKGVYKLYKADGVYSLTLQKDQIKETKK